MLTQLADSFSEAQPPYSCCQVSLLADISDGEKSGLSPVSASWTDGEWWGAWGSQRLGRRLVFWGSMKDSSKLRWACLENVSAERQEGTVKSLAYKT